MNILLIVTILSLCLANSYNESLESENRAALQTNNSPEESFKVQVAHLQQKKHTLAIDGKNKDRKKRTRSRRKSNPPINYGRFAAEKPYFGESHLERSHNPNPTCSVEKIPKNGNKKVSIEY